MTDNTAVRQAAAPRMGKAAKALRKFKNPYTVITFIVLALYALSLLTVLLWALSASFKSKDEFFNSPVWLPKAFTFESYLNAFKNFSKQVFNDDGMRNILLPEMFLYSIIYALTCAFTATLSPCIMGYMTAKFPNKVSKAITMVVIVCMILPIVGALPSEIQMAKALGLYDSFIGMMIMKGNFLGMYFLIFQTVFKGVPNTFAEAAKIDGASNFRVFVQIMLPVARNTFFTIMLLRFIEFWNDYQTPLIYLKSYPTAAAGLYELNFMSSNEVSKSVPAKLAGAMAMMIPIVIIYVIFHKKLMGNVTMGGIKG